MNGDAPLNIPLIRKTLDFIREHPEKHNQKTWATKTPCGTTMCFAGTAIWLSGGEFRFNEYGIADVVLQGQLSDEDFYREGVSWDGRAFGDVTNTAENLLGLSRSESEYLFPQATSLEDLETYVAWMVKDRIEFGEDLEPWV